MMAFKRIERAAQPYIYVDKECAYGPGIAAAMGEAFGTVFGFVEAAGLSPVSMPMTVYLGMDPEVLRFRGGVMVSAEDAEKAEGEIKADLLPGGAAMQALHVGPYDRLNETHQAMWRHMEEAGIPAAMPVWEVYIDDPGAVAPEVLRTEVYRAIG